MIDATWNPSWWCYVIEVMVGVTIPGRYSTRKWQVNLCRRLSREFRRLLGPTIQERGSKGGREGEVSYLQS